VTVENPATVSHTFTGSLGGKVLTSYHALSLSSPSAVSASLDWNKDDLDLYLLDGKGQVIASSATTKRPETISTGLLPAGDYQFKVVCVSVRGKTQYTLTVECSPQ